MLQNQIKEYTEKSNQVNEVSRKIEEAIQWLCDESGNYAKTVESVKAKAPEQRDIDLIVSTVNAGRDMEDAIQFLASAHDIVLRYVDLFDGILNMLKDQEYQELAEEGEQYIPDHSEDEDEFIYDEDNNVIGLKNEHDD